uniref:Defensin 3 n=1 Tax=Datisca glomerata TaxID=34297 RepID=A0A6M3RGB4_DATGL|nr:defensin 3 [Datisca glomerata]
MISFRCNHRCRRWENAARGVCQRSFGLRKECHCYFEDCPETSTTGEGHSNTPAYEEAPTTKIYRKSLNHDTEPSVLEETGV